MDKSPTQWMTTPLARYATFAGRARRKEYWWFWVFTLLVVTAATIIDVLLLGIDRMAYGGAGPATGIAALALIVPSLAVSVRRLHDGDKSGWFVLVGLLPLIGGLVLLYWYVKRGTVGDNRFGADPVS